MMKSSMLHLATEVMQDSVLYAAQENLVTAEPRWLQAYEVFSVILTPARVRPRNSAMTALYSLTVSTGISQIRLISLQV